MSPAAGRLELRSRCLPAAVLATCRSCLESRQSPSPSVAAAAPRELGVLLAAAAAPRADRTARAERSAFCGAVAAAP